MSPSGSVAVWKVPWAAAKCAVPPSMTPSKLAGPRVPVAGHWKAHDELLVIHGFLARVRRLTAAHADALASHARPRPGHAETTRHGRG